MDRPDLWSARRFLTDRLALHRPFAAARHDRTRILLLSVDERIAQTQILPFFLAARELWRSRNGEVRELPMRAFEQGANPYPDVDIVCFQTWFDLTPAVLSRLVDRIEQCWPSAKLVYLDWFAPTDLRYAAVLNDRVAVYVKKQILARRADYGAPTAGDTTLTDYFGKRYGLDMPLVAFDVPESFWPKLVLGAGFEVAPQIRAESRAAALPRRDRPIDLHARISAKGTAWYSAMRNEAQQAVARVGSRYSVLSEGYVSRGQFFRELRMSKICFSPFGYGEICWRDFEAIGTGAVLLKPDISHLLLAHHIFKPGTTYVPVRWDLSDFDEKLQFLLDHPAEREAIAQRAYDALASVNERTTIVSQVIDLIDKVRSASNRSAALAEPPARDSGRAASGSLLPPISARYLLTIGVPSFRDQAGRRYVDPLWHKDLCEHARYLQHLTVVAPCGHGPLPSDAVCIDDDARLEAVRFVDLPSSSSLLRGLAELPAALRILWRAIRGADIVHSTIAGWPIPLGWLAMPMVALQKKSSLIVVESAFWRVPPGVRPTLRARLRASISERLGRWCLNRADLSIFSQPEYLRSLLRTPGKGHVIPAAWIDESAVLSDAQAGAVWRRNRVEAGSPLKLAFVGRLVPEKGVKVLLDAMHRLEAARVQVELDIVGDGDLLDLCAEASRHKCAFARVNLGGTSFRYGSAFFDMLRNYHAVVIPSITDEQPRIVFDCYSQAIPVIASDTPGLRSCVANGVTGRLVQPGDPEALAGVIASVKTDIAGLERMGLAALEVARKHTHRRMHEERQVLLLARFNTKAALSHQG